MGDAPGDVWIAAYALGIAAAAATVFLRRDASLLRGRSLFIFTLAYVTLALGSLWLRQGAIPARVLIAGVAAVAVTASLAPWWFVLGGPRASVVETIEVCLGRVCARYERVDGGFVMAVPGGGLHLRLHALPTERFTVLSFRARPAHRKGALFQRLLAKQYRGVLPTLRVTMR